MPRRTTVFRSAAQGERARGRVDVPLEPHTLCVRGVVTSISCQTKAAGSRRAAARLAHTSMRTARRDAITREGCSQDVLISKSIASLLLSSRSLLEACCLLMREESRDEMSAKLQASLYVHAQRPPHHVQIRRPTYHISSVRPHYRRRSATASPADPDGRRRSDIMLNLSFLYVLNGQYRTRF